MTTINREEQLHADITESERLRDPVPDGMATPTRLHGKLGKPVPIRLPDPILAEIKQVADDRDVPVSALMRSWIMAGLRAEAQPSATVEGAVERLTADLDALRQIITAPH